MKKNLIFLIIVFLVLTLIFVDFRLDRFGAVETEWVDFIYLNNKIYHLEYGYIDDQRHEVLASAEDIEEQIGKIKFNISDHVSSDHYKYRNWDASYLEKGTKIYKLFSLSEDQSIAAYKDGQYYIYSVLED